ncbi:hypothetical protein FHT40_005868 [Mycolicibacterium sp. BK556]|uniref:hypothetical protein n=1 Tax=Mycobacteriaceae TaxID=1762 RepID=UPI00105ED58F|nr:MULTISPECIES: hypothetical protein [Mycobacteriaceae]MBB3606179.1 hypothetical protein [Mycolicibacterium sp. BK556]MBB3632757.1 hypothetical protein [Mycolicibacterium sp. BK607]MBB3754106.1 hypothetical protein [Mycolicibacterium sp. BK634]TDO17920.1 hypothetical protein EV580_1098 [Mycobacterium sp. BK086]
MWLTLLKILLVIFLVGSAAVIVVVGVRRSRANRGDPRWSQQHQGQPGHLASIRGIMPKTPLPPPFSHGDTENDNPERSA